mmetsp:Transcript_43860/g.72855  ORF Transcript_43860/g.72855 Transcript_43860/m.72855 type:complete len:322 (-) Transcript_43860:129-1094(-)
MLNLDFQSPPLFRTDTEPTNIPGFDQKAVLYSVESFKSDFSALIQRLDVALAHNRYRDYKVYLVTVPELTIAPYLKGFGEPKRQQDGTYYFDTYGYFFATSPKVGSTITMEQARFVDRQIQGYNKHIKSIVSSRSNFHLVDIAGELNKLAYLRNNGKPTYVWPKGATEAIVSSLGNDFIPDTRLYETERLPWWKRWFSWSANGYRVKKGGLFSLDGLHPTAIAQGLFADEMMKVIRKAEKKTRIDSHSNDFAKHNDESEDGLSRLLWEKIVASDSLLQNPVPLYNEFTAGNENKILRNIAVRASKILSISAGAEVADDDTK